MALQAVEALLRLRNHPGNHGKPAGCCKVFPGASLDPLCISKRSVVPKESSSTDRGKRQFDDKTNPIMKRHHAFKCSRFTSCLLISVMSEIASLEVVSLCHS